MTRRALRIRTLRAGLLTGALTLGLAGGLVGCSSFEIHEALCSKGEEPVWSYTLRNGAQCVRDGDEPPPGFARYPRGRVPVWINPPRSYDNRTADGHDRYNRNPNDPDYPWWDEVVAEHPEFACDDSAEPVGRIALKPGAAAVVVSVNSVGNHCFAFDWPRRLGSVSAAEVSVRLPDWPTPWSRTASDDASAREPLRIAAQGCLTVSATLRLEGRDGTVSSYAVDAARVADTC